MPREILSKKWEDAGVQHLAYGTVVCAGREVQGKRLVYIILGLKLHVDKA